MARFRAIDFMRAEGTLSYHVALFAPWFTNSINESEPIVY